MCPLDMDFSTNMSILSTEQNFTLERLSVYDLSLLRKCLVWLETSTAVIALAVNILVITALIGNNASCRGYFHGLLNLSLAQCFLSIASLTSTVSSLLILDYNYSPFTSKDFWLRSVLHNISLAIFSGLCVTGASALSWTHWWSLNIWMNHTEMPTGYRVVKVMFYVLWLTTIMFATWLNLLNTVWAIGLTTTVAENDEVTVRPFLRIYSMTMFVSAGLLLFSNVTSIPAVTGHMTSRAVQSNHQPDCRDADCVCSDSEADDMSNSRDPIPGATSITSPQSNKETDQQRLKNPAIPTIVTFSDDDKENEEQNSSATENEINSFNKVNNLRPYTGENILSSGPSTDALPTVCNLSIYSADISANSATEYLADSALKLSVERLHQRLQQLNDSRPIPPPDPESPQSSFTTSITVERKRTKKKRKASKKFKGVKIIQLERPNRVQVSVLLSFAFFYMPPWLLLVVAIYIPHHATNLLPILRLLINVINSINPLLQGFRHPRFAIKLARTWRKIYPLRNNVSQDNFNRTRCQN